MTAVAPPLNFQPSARLGWSAPNAAPNGITSNSADDVRMFMPRKSAQRTNSSSSVASVSSNSTITAPPPQLNGTAGPSPDASWAARKKPARGLWPTSKAEPISGISTARPQNIATSTSGPSAASAISALHTPSSMLPSQHPGQPQGQQNGAPRSQGMSEMPAILHLIPLNGTFERKTITVPYYPEVLRIGRQTNNKTIPTPTNGYFDSKVLSRQHAEVWADRTGKIFIRDVKSSNGTFVNGNRLSPENRDSEPHELREQDMLELGIDIVSEDQKTIVHHKVAAKIEHAGIYNSNGSVMDLNFGELDNGNIMVPHGNQAMGQMRGRNGSQGSVGSNGRLGPGQQNMVGGNVNMITQQRHTNFWLQPITMEQIVKKLNSEMKQARQQSQELQRTAQYIESLSTTDPKKDSSKISSLTKHSPLKGDIKTRFSEPPAPPPSQPLPEKPDVAQQPSLRRADTEKPKLLSNNSSKGDSSLQITSLVEALTTQKKEFDMQSLRLKELEEMLAQERLARESAEERAQRLEMENRKDSIADSKHQAKGVIPDPSDSSAEFDDTRSESTVVIETPQSGEADASTSRLQQRLESMVAEMDQMRKQMENYRKRAEKAESDSVKDRESLASMIERLRNDEADRVAKAASGKRRKSVTFADDVRDVDGASESNHPTKESAESHGSGTSLSHTASQNGRAVGKDQSARSKTPNPGALVQSLQGNEQLAHVGPYASMVGVVVLGLSIMAYINGWQKPLER
ncbi:hypothetical protein K490DRAFT_72021 [Saccharata proteae CBS 121410]|uniref:FHA domain-containing protein n=1 Tax=Saccharata proteae CBS 121410 TaxID=1314787 RepID=A0A9P4I0B9_9PEZI|nr:hypothetical protein K490DRAFT_72021 [Saccharata proteae CBS 121410]